MRGSESLCSDFKKDRVLATYSRDQGLSERSAGLSDQAWKPSQYDAREDEREYD